MKKSAVAKAIVLTIGATDFTFSPTVADHNNYTNDLMPDNKIAPAHTFLSRTVAPEQKEALVELLDTVPGLVMEVFMEINKASRGGLKVALKN
ncbi:putative phage tail assembly chaperone [Psychromonas sp. SR45-3]|uniref:putative phage tail assembly chaperone n=1 Tax=Psychromonas sp. SR45-3 TaxID=2760930 RepID=UPI0015FC3D59|nr:putative phage tail assembly chaperone [Psychromonas sp. SR45-3]MBB1272526.1 hypothetical protein [Psychromonas sp. SR45-3]